MRKKHRVVKQFFVALIAEDSGLSFNPPWARGKYSDGSAMRVEYAHARNEFILAAASPLAQVRFCADLVFDRDNGGPFVSM